MTAELTPSSEDDASTLPDLLDQIEAPILRFTADGAHDQRSVYDQVGAAGTEDVVIVIPPLRSAVSAAPTDTTNNRMELTALIAAFEVLPEDADSLASAWRLVGLRCLYQFEC